ncbi:hypothetical protein CC78DRAFT_538201 [Lojkania enalia]|uniref:TLC domain-containing protein n=1 Tax=Lojkania enalia TaxID=147567 RepID=A0A9P4JZI5_9PLEO|nr:hypothetical protein CC78DRAFT_538201 [Didymosphaeria enalia]
MDRKSDLQGINKAVSSLHAVATSITAFCILKYSGWAIPKQKSDTSPSPVDGENHPDDSLNPMIAGRSRLANALTAWETIYLLADTWFMVYANRKRYSLPSNSAGLRIVAKQSPILLIHHVVLTSAFLVLQSYIAAGKEKGLWVITAFMLMNSSNPLMHARWFVRRRTGRSSNFLDLVFLAAFATSRFGVVVWILRKYGRYHRLGVWQAYRSLREECQIGTAMLVGLNGAWWSILAAKVATRNLRKLK